MNSFIKFAKRNDAISFLDRYFIRRPYFRLIDKTFSKLLEIEKFSEGEKTILQKNRMLVLLQHAYKNCPYYRRLFERSNINVNSLDNLPEIPILTKEIIREHGSDMIACNINKFSLVRRNTGGSTGEPLEFYSDRNACALDLAYHKFLYRKIGYHPGDVIAAAGGITIPKRYRDKNIYWTRQSRYNIWYHIGFSGIYLNDNTVGYYFEQFVRSRPAILRGYPSFWDTLARYILARGIKIDFKVKGANLTAETCLPAQREAIETAFNTKTFLEYGQTELSLFCYTDGSSYTYQTAPLYGYIEVIKDNGEYANEGEEGDVIATSLCNLGMPFIRYKTGDRIVVLRRAGGMVWFNDFQGRTQDYILDKDNQKVALTSLIFGQHFKAFKNIVRWQFQQEEIGKVCLKVVKGPSYNQEDEKEIKGIIAGSSRVDLDIRYVDQISTEKNGKFLFLVKRMKGQA